MKLSISIMMHPSRAEHLPYLLERLGDVPVSMDTDSNIWHTCREAWRLHDPSADFHLVVQDDALVCDDFHARAQQAITEGPHSLYLGMRKAYLEKVTAALPSGEITLPYMHWGLAVCLPTDLVEPMIAYGDASDLPITHDDTRIKTFLRERGLTVRHPLPSLIDHRPEVSIVTGEMNPKRRAIFYADRMENA